MHTIISLLIKYIYLRVSWLAMCIELKLIAWIFPGLSHHSLPSSSISIGKQLQLKYDVNQK